MNALRHTPTADATDYRGTERLLWGSVLGLLTFWLFAGTMGAVARAVLLNLNGAYSDPVTHTWAHPAVAVDQMNLAVSLTALFSGLFIVFVGGLADRVGRVRVALAGNVLGILGSLLVVLASGHAALPLLLVGRAVQGLSGACIMPSTMALVKTYWNGPARQRALSMWSIGTFGGSSLTALLGGLVAADLGWRWIFVFSIAASVASFAMIWGTPESRVGSTHARFDVLGLLFFLVTVMCLDVGVTFGKQLGWTSGTELVLAAGFVVGLALFLWWDAGGPTRSWSSPCSATAPTPAPWCRISAST